jgi:5-methylcytosine-specific restriction endonuclease McrBC regulatory subunit McrC
VLNLINNPKITLIELDEPKTYPINKLKDWFPPGKFDMRTPWVCVKKWIDTNRKYLDFLGINCSWDNDNGLTLETSNKIGLAPIKNPYGGKVYGSITVKSRIGWIKISEILDAIEWKLKPDFLETEEPIMSDGVLPRWLKAIDTLRAIERALQLHLRGMKEIHEVKDNPVGRVNWNDYSLRNIPSGKWNRFNCTLTNYSLDLDIHRQFKGIVEQIEKDLLDRYVPPDIRRRASPTLQRILKVLENVKSELPNVDQLRKSNIPSFYRSVYEDAKARAIEYISQSRFSMYSAEFFGLPWSIEMDQLFEFWVEFWSYRFSKQIGANFYSDIRGNSKIKFIPLGRWEGLRDLKPDIIIEKDEHTMVIDVKYKKHLLYLKLHSFTKDILEEHRKDVHQILAYAGSSSNPDKKAVLLYPRLLKESIVEKAEVINYKNSYINLTLFKIDTSFDSSELLAKLHSIWKNYVAGLFT